MSMMMMMRPMTVQRIANRRSFFVGSKFGEKSFPAGFLHLQQQHQQQQQQQRRSYKMDHKEYQDKFEQSVTNRKEFWANAAKDLIWHKPFEKVLDENNEGTWFGDGELSICYNAVDRWVDEGKGDQVAIYYDSPVTGNKKSISFKELQEQVSKFAGALAERNVSKGDRVVIYMPMIPEALVAMLACTRLGAIHSVVFGGFASNELASRINHAKPKAVVSASCGIEPTRIIPYAPMLEQALQIVDSPVPTVIVKHRGEVSDPANEFPRKDFEEWENVMETAKPHDCVFVKSTDPSYILTTSGTTGAPKGVLRDTGGYATALKWSMKNIMGLDQHETYFAASDIGWVVGHSYIVYGPLLHGCSSVLFEGKPILAKKDSKNNEMDPGIFWRIVQDYGVKSMFTAPTAIRAIRKFDPELKEAKKYNLENFETLFLAGERADPDTVEFCQKGLGIDIVDNYWQTELGFPGLAFQTVGAKPGSAGKPVMGFEFEILNESSEPVGDNILGDLAIKKPLPPGTFTTLFGADEKSATDAAKRFHEVYFAKHQDYYNTGDVAFRDDDGYYNVMARSDDVINVAGHRLSSGRIEEAIMHHPLVTECAVIGVNDEEKGQVPIGFIVSSAPVSSSEEEGADVEKQVIQMVRDDIGPVASFKFCFATKALPKTRSGKILRNVMTKLANGNKLEEVPIPGTIEDLNVVESIASDISDRWLRRAH